MFYRLYCSSENTVGADEYVCYSEIGEDGYWLRYVEINADGTALKYDAGHAADRPGTLPEGKWNEKEMSRKEYGTVVVISGELFQAVWLATNETP
jgi:hypothetical protein